MSFQAKLKKLLALAVERQKIEPSHASGLIKPARSSEFSTTRWLTLGNALGLLGGLIVLLGAILMISANWWRISDPAKFIGFLALLGGTHFAGLYVRHHGYSILSHILHLIGAGLFIAGFGLLAQIFHITTPGACLGCLPLSP